LQAQLNQKETTMRFKSSLYGVLAAGAVACGASAQAQT
jgi:hypothetical protein